MSEWIARHAYFAESTVLFLLGLLVSFVLPRHRKLILLGGFLTFPYALFSSLHVPHFWNPEFTFFFVSSPEDFLWLGYTGFVTVFFAILPFHRTIVWQIRPRRVLARYLAMNLAAGAAFVVLFTVMGGIRSIMPATLLAMVALAAGLLVLNPGVWKMSLVGSVGFTAIHWLDVIVFFHLWPHTKAYWNSSASLPWSVVGVPGYEVLWSLVFGATWPLVVARCCELRLLPGPARPAESH